MYGNSAQPLPVACFKQHVELYIFIHSLACSSVLFIHSFIHYVISFFFFVKLDSRNNIFLNHFATHCWRRHMQSKHKEHPQWNTYRHSVKKKQQQKKKKMLEQQQQQKRNQREIKLQKCNKWGLHQKEKETKKKKGNSRNFPLSQKRKPFQFLPCSPR